MENSLIERGASLQPSCKFELCAKSFECRWHLQGIILNEERDREEKEQGRWGTGKKKAREGERQRKTWWHATPSNWVVLHAQNMRVASWTIKLPPFLTFVSFSLSFSLSLLQLQFLQFRWKLCYTFFFCTQLKPRKCLCVCLCVWVYECVCVLLC